jgi:hypothetical protein
MRLQDRRCFVCGCSADVEQTSAHLAKVMWFCTNHGTAFHTSVEFHAARVARSTAECWRAIDAWFAAVVPEVTQRAA